MEQKRFEIDGHEYLVTPHDGLEGIPILAEIAAIAAEPLLNFMKTQIVKGQAEGLDVAAVMAEIDVSEVSKNIRESLHRLAERPQIIQAVFARTVRDGQPLSNPTAFKMAFQGRWVEMLKALAEIIKINGFIPF